MTKTIVDLTTASILEFIIESFKLSKFRLNCNWVIINSYYFVWFGLETLYHKELIWPFVIFSFYTIIWTLSFGKLKITNVSLNCTTFGFKFTSQGINAPFLF